MQTLESFNFLAKTNVKFRDLQIRKILNPFMHNAPKWPDTL